MCKKTAAAAVSYYIPWYITQTGKLYVVRVYKKKCVNRVTNIYYDGYRQVLSVVLIVGATYDCFDFFAFSLLLLTAEGEQSKYTQNNCSAITNRYFT